VMNSYKVFLHHLTILRDGLYNLERIETANNELTNLMMEIYKLLDKNSYLF